MVRFKVIKQIVDKGRRVGFVVKDNKTNQILKLTDNQIKAYFIKGCTHDFDINYNNRGAVFKNSKYTIKNLPKVELKENTTLKSRIVLYHGSSKEYVKPKYGLGEDKHDYGKGFYLTQNKELAKEWAVSGESEVGYLHKYVLDIRDLNVYDYESNTLAWIAELMYHRDAASTARYKKLAPLFIKKYRDMQVVNADVIVGWRADSSYFYITKCFVRDELDVRLLNEALKLGDLGIQYCIKSQKAYAKLKSENDYYAEEIVNSEYKMKYNKRDNKARSDMYDLVNSKRNTLKHTFSSLL